jgi:hypothetical protein
MSRWYSANVLQTLPGGRRLWRFSARGSRFVFDSEKTLTLQEPAPPAAVAKNWQSLVRPRLNIAWLPPDKVFFRAVQLPGADAAEIAAMVELQLEKLSPLPVTHIVWSLYLMPRNESKPDALRTVIVIIAARGYVEEFLGDLERQGFLADRIECPGLDQLLSAKMNGDGLWFFPGGPGEPALIVWHYGGAIQNLTLLPLPEGPERAPQLKAHIEQIAWAGELEGWLAAPPRIHLVAGPAEAEAWRPLFAEWADHGIETVAPAAPAELAAASAQRAGTNVAATSLLPPEFGARYHRQLMDRLWMRGVMAVVSVYLLVVLGYFAALFEKKSENDNAHKELAGLGAAYTNALLDDMQIRVITERQNLKYAALDCWAAVAANLPENLTLDTLYFNRAKIEISGTGNTELPDDVYDFQKGLRKAADATQTNPLFTNVTLNYTRVQSGKTAWSFTCSIKSIEAP